MNTGRKRRHNPNVLAALAPHLLNKPLDYILADHHRQRELFALCDDLAAGERLELKLAGRIASFLENEMALHMKDEMEDLLPMVRGCPSIDESAIRVINLLAGENAADEALTSALAKDINAAICAGQSELSDELRNALIAYSDRQRRHLALENAVVIPLAQRLLSKSDQADLTRRMTARRTDA